MSSSGTCTTHGEEDAGPEPPHDDDGVGSNLNATNMETAHEPPFAQMGQANAACLPAIVQWLKKVSQCFPIFERMTWHKSGKLSNNVKIIYVIVHHLRFLTSPRSCDLD